MGHPNLSDEINRNIENSEAAGGLFVKDIPINGSAFVWTKNRRYKISKDANGLLYISGHPRYCPESTPCTINGSTWGGSMLKIGFIGRGMHMEFVTSYGQITTTIIQDVSIDDGP